jgi:hypothetical protein
MATNLWQITQNGTVLVQNLPYPVVYEIVQILQGDNMQGLLLSQMGS